MTKDSHAAVVWFEKGILFHKLGPKDIGSSEALGDGFKCLVFGLGVFCVVVAIAFLVQTGAKPDFMEFAGLSIFGFIQAVNTALLIVALFGLLQLLRVQTSLKDVAVVGCYALGGLLPIVSVSIGYFLYLAVQLAVEHGDPSQPYLRAAVYQALLNQEQAVSLRIIVWVLVLIPFFALPFYLAKMVALLSRASRHPNRILTTVAVLGAFSVDMVMVKMTFSLIFWRLIIQQAAGRHG
jgi:hypothetical protein